MTLPPDIGLRVVREYASANRSLAVLVTTYPALDDPSIAVVNAAVIGHPADGHPVVAFVGRRGRKLDNLRARPRATLVFQHDWDWVAVRGPVELSGPDDTHASINGEQQRQLLRNIYHAAGGEHSDLAEYDTAMAVERRCAVLVEPERIWTNPPGAEHREPRTTP